MPRKQTKPLTVEEVARHHWQDARAAYLTENGDLHLVVREVVVGKIGGRARVMRERMVVTCRVVVPADRPDLQRQALDTWLPTGRDGLRGYRGSQEKALLVLAKDLDLPLADGGRVAA